MVLPYLIYPLGEIDNDPAQLITFLGITAKPKATTEAERSRASVTIEFFKLNNRGELRRGRSTELKAMFAVLELRRLASTDQERTDYDDLITLSCSPVASHSSRCESFRQLYDTDPESARLIFNECRDLLKQKL